MTFRMMDPPKSQVCSGTRIPATPLWGRPSQPPSQPTGHKRSQWLKSMWIAVWINIARSTSGPTEFRNLRGHLGMDQYLLIPFLGEWTSIYQLFWCSPGVQGFDPSPFNVLNMSWWNNRSSAGHSPEGAPKPWLHRSPCNGEILWPVETVSDC